MKFIFEKHECVEFLDVLKIFVVWDFHAKTFCSNLIIFYFLFLNFWILICINIYHLIVIQEVNSLNFELGKRETTFENSQQMWAVRFDRYANFITFWLSTSIFDNLMVHVYICCTCYILCYLAWFVLIYNDHLKLVWCDTYFSQVSNHCYSLNLY